MILALSLTTALGAPAKVGGGVRLGLFDRMCVQSSEELTNSLIALKSNPTEKPAARQKRSVSYQLRV